MKIVSAIPILFLLLLATGTPAADDRHDVGVNNKNRNLNINKVYNKNPPVVASTFNQQAFQPFQPVQPVQRGPCRVYWPFNTNLDAIDNNGNTISDITNDGAASLSTSTFAKGGGSLYLDGTGRGLQLPADATDTVTRAASWCWFYSARNFDNFPYMLNNFNEVYGNAEQESFYSFVGPSTFLLGEIQLSDSSYLDLGITTPDSSTRFLQACETYDGVNVRLYLNGELQKALTITTKAILDLLIPNPPIGYKTSTVIAPFTGYLDEILICDRALTPFEVKAHYAGPQQMLNAGLITKLE